MAGNAGNAYAYAPMAQPALVTSTGQMHFVLGATATTAQPFPCGDKRGAQIVSIQGPYWAGVYVLVRTGLGTAGVVSQLAYVNEDSSQYPDLVVEWAAGAYQPTVAMSSTAGPANLDVYFDITMLS